MTTAIYACILAVLICRLSMNVIKARRRNKVALGDGDCKELIVARSAQSNAIDYCPIALILMLFLELNGGHVILIHIAGVLFVSGRIIHGRAILREDLRGRVRGMQLTFFMIYALVALNLVYFPWMKLLPA